MHFTLLTAFLLFVSALPAQTFRGTLHGTVIDSASGAVADPGAVSDSPGSFGVVSVNGNRGRSNNYLLDGTDMNDGYRNDPSINEAGVFGVPATLLPFDAIAEVPVISARTRSSAATRGRSSTS